jgi:uncharacterized protein (DUF433 family)
VVFSYSLLFFCKITANVHIFVPTQQFLILQRMYIYKNIITLEPGKRSGRPCIRGMRITVEDILRWLASEMTFEHILSDFPELTKQDLVVALEFAALRQHRTAVAAS